MSELGLRTTFPLPIYLPSNPTPYARVISHFSARGSFTTNYSHVVLLPVFEGHLTQPLIEPRARKKERIVAPIRLPRCEAVGVGCLWLTCALCNSPICRVQYILLTEDVQPIHVVAEIAGRLPPTVVRTGWRFRLGAAIRHPFCGLQPFCP